MNRSHPPGNPVRDTAVSAPAVRQARTIAVVFGALFLLLILGFASMVFFVQNEARLNAIGPIAATPGAERGGLVFHGTANIWEVRGRMTLDARRQVRFEFDLVSPTGQAAPAGLDLRLMLDMPDRDNSTIAVAASHSLQGSRVATAILPEAGRWRLRMVFPEITGVFEFDVDE